MPRELIATAPRTPRLREYDDPPLEPTQIRIRTELASPKHGTELVAYRNDPVASRPYDPAWGAVIPKPPEAALAGFPIRLGNMAVGVVIETGADVARFAVGDRVFGHFPIRKTQTVDETRADPLPDGLSPEAALCLAWLTSGRIRTEGIIGPIVPFEDAADAYRMIDEHPERSIKLGIRFP